MGYVGLGGLSKKEKDADAFYNTIHLISVAVAVVPGFGTVFGISLEIIGQIGLLIASGGDLKKFSKAELRAVAALAPFTKMVLGFIPGVPPSVLPAIDSIGKVAGDVGNGRNPSSADVATVGTGVTAAAASSSNPDLSKAALAVQSAQNLPGMKEIPSLLPGSLAAKAKTPVKVKGSRAPVTTTVDPDKSKPGLLQNRAAIVGLGALALLGGLWIGMGTKKRRR